MRLPTIAASVAVAGACASFTGVPADASVSDAGDDGNVMSAPSEASVPDGGSSQSCAAIAGAIACFDFDTPPSSIPPSFGFDGLTKHDDAQIALESSAISGAGQALGFALSATPSDDHTSYGSFDIKDFAQHSTIIVDADVTIWEDGMQYAILIGLVALGDSCATIQALADNGGDLELRGDGDSASSLGSYALGKPFHLHLESGVRAGEQGSTVLTITDEAGSRQATTTTTYASSCTSLSMWVGAWYTSQKSDESLHVQFDRIVVTAK